MIILVDRSFLHLIAPENPPVSTPIRPIIDFIDQKQDPFMYIITKCYMSKEFYGIIIDIGASKKSIAGYK
jgi:hypothetical protein